MPIGARSLSIGPRIGPRIGLAGGGSMAGVDMDATSGKFIPSTAAQWATTFTAAGVSSAVASLYLPGRVSSGNIPDLVGSLNLTAAGTLAYQDPVTGWSEKGVRTTTGQAGTMLTTSASLPDIGTTSCALLAYVLLPASSAALRTVVQLGAVFNTEMSAEVNSTPKTMIFQLDPNTATGAADNTNIVRPIWITINRTAGTAALDTDLEELTATLTATPTGKQFLLGGDNVMSNFPPTATYLMAIRLDGANAELTKAGRRSVLQTLGFSIPW